MIWLLLLAGLTAAARTIDRLSPREISSLANATNLHAIDFRDSTSFLAQILVPRPPESKNLQNAQNLIRNHFKQLSTTINGVATWEPFEDAFTSKTPEGEKSFVNLVYTHDPNAPLKLVIAAHIDSKWFAAPPNDGFVGATDSAAPCAMMIDMAEALSPLLDADVKRWESSDAPNKPRTTLQFIFFDGEEAFHSWTSTDSIYGARHLADLWSKPPKSPSPSSAVPDSLSQISAFVLLDLLGAPNPTIRSYWLDTGYVFDHMVDVEARIAEAGHMWDEHQGEDWQGVSATNAKGRSFFVPRGSPNAVYYGRIEDDHIPFLDKGVPILHMIANPFPRVWHTLKDDITALDWPTMKAWTILMRIFSAEYLGLTEENDKNRARDELVNNATYSIPGMAAFQPFGN